LEYRDFANKILNFQEMKKGLKLRNYKHLKFSTKDALSSNPLILANPSFYLLQQLMNTTKVLVN